MGCDAIGTTLAGFLKSDVSALVLTFSEKVRFNSPAAASTTAVVLATTGVVIAVVVPPVPLS